ncbi:MAG: hypothetical protein D8M59_14845 [Planctomycetes bacterium]|nr:hypothetical protein [Planctomycetota bacterium]NOG55031.1 redoxin domain-containing protein [Planctomycetota bacterium]
MKRAFASSVALLCTAALMTSSAMARPPKKGDKLPAVRVTDLHNNDEYNVDLNDLEGYVVVVEFWATWCGPCKRSIPHLNELHHEYADDGVVIIGVSDEPSSKVAPFIKTMPMDYIVASGGGQANKDFGIRGIPHAFVVDAKGIVQWDGHPQDSGFEKAIEKALKDTPPTRRLGGGPEHNERVLAKAEANLKAGDIDGALVSLRRLDHDSIPEGEGHAARLRSVRGQLEPVARSKFNVAMEDVKAQRYVEAMTALEYVATKFKGLSIPVADQAAEQLKKLENDPAVLKAKRSAANEKLAANMLKRATKYAAADEHEAAYRKMLALVDKYPDTAAAVKARAQVAEYESDDEFIRSVVDQVKDEKGG